MKLLGLDIEIGNPFEMEDGITPWPKDQAWLTEIACVLYDTDMGQAPVKSYEALINEGKGVSEKAEQYTGISPELVEKYGENPTEVAARVFEMLKDCDYVVAQNGNESDRPWLKAFLLRYLGEVPLRGLGPKKWIDTLTDVEYPDNCRSKNLTYLNGFHGFCNPFPHRAASDVQSMMKVLFNYDLERVIKLSESPWVGFKALGPIDLIDWNMPGAKDKKNRYFQKGTEEYKEMELWKKKVKNARFRWDGDAEKTGQKCWYKILKQIHIDEGQAQYDFETVRLQGEFSGPL